MSLTTKTARWLWGLLVLVSLGRAAPAEDPAPAAPTAAEGVPTVAAVDPAAAAGTGSLEGLRFEGGEPPALRGRDARLQFLVTGEYPGGQTRDLSGNVTYAVEPAGIVEVGEQGFVTPLGDGRARVIARLEGLTKTHEAAIEVEVRQMGETIPVNFPNQIVPIFTKLGCNGGGCHGKSGGQNGFSLSLLGFYPDEDHEFLVKEARGRRIFPAAPDRSLLLLKATNAVPHGGGQRMERDAHEYRLIRRWLAQGMPYGSDGDAHVARIEVIPRERTMERRAEQRLAVRAYYSDGSVEDVTRMAQYEANVKELAEADAEGVVRTLDLAGDVAVMVRYQGHVDVFRATVPLGVEITTMPEVRNLVDEHVFAKLRRLGIPPSAVCDDSTFLRRVTVDIAGRLPTAAQSEAFLADASADKRDRWIDRLLASTDYADYFANKWSAILRNKRVNDSYTHGTYSFHQWIRQSLHKNMPYDEFARSIIAATGRVDQHPPVAWYRAVDSVEEQVEDTAQLFLGLRIQCARCHHHPFEVWSQQDYYSFAAFFSRVGRKDGSDGVGTEPRIFHRRGKAEARNPRSGAELVPAGLGARPLELSPDDDPRQALVDWQTDPANPFFAPALVNRYWKHFFGRGLVEPEDDMRVTNPPTHPELLAALAKEFIASGFDLKALVRTLCQSSAYQLAAMPNEHNERDQQNYSRFYPRRLNAEVLFDAIDQFTGARTQFPGLPAEVRAVGLPDTGANNYFLTVFGRPMADSSCECERSSDANLAQSLHLMNSEDIQKKISAGDGRAAQLAKREDIDDAAKFRELNLWAFSRAPTAEETQLAVDYVARSENKQQAWEDLVWALINTKEFLFNH